MKATNSMCMILFYVTPTISIFRASPVISPIQGPMEAYFLHLWGAPDDAFVWGRDSTTYPYPPIRLSMQASGGTAEAGEELAEAGGHSSLDLRGGGASDTICSVAFRRLP
jgi:hypothetical protein